MNHRETIRRIERLIVASGKKRRGERSGRDRAALELLRDFRTMIKDLEAKDLEPPINKSKPTIEELEAILNSRKKVTIEFLPNGEIKTKDLEPRTIVKDLGPISRDLSHTPPGLKQISKIDVTGPKAFEVHDLSNSEEINPATKLYEFLRPGLQIVLGEHKEPGPDYDHLHVAFRIGEEKDPWNNFIVPGLLALAEILNEREGLIQCYPIVGRKHIVDNDICINILEGKTTVYSLLVNK